MKKYIKKTALLFALLAIISCNNKAKTEFVNTYISENYKIELPVRFEKTNEGIWEVPNTSFNILSVNINNGLVKNLKEEVENESKSTQKASYYKDMVFVKSEEFEKNGFTGVISYYEKDNKGNRLGLVTLKSYVIIAIVQDDISNIKFVSISLSNNINDDISYSIKSLSKNKSVAKINLFDEKKARNNGFQIFNDENFIIKCKGNLLLDKLRYEQFEKEGQANSKPYHVFKNGVDYNINISDMSSLLNGRSKEEIDKYNKDDLEYYQTKFDEMGIKNELKKFKGFDAVYYENTVDGKLSKALYFHNDMKSYMLQVTSKSETKKLFEEFINSFDLINK